MIDASWAASVEVEVVVVVGVDDLDSSAFGVQRLERVGADAEQLLQAPVDLGRRRERQREIATAGQAKLVERRVVAQVAHGDDGHAVALFQRQQSMSQQDLGGKFQQEFASGRRFKFVEIDVRQLERLGEEAEQRLFGDAVGGKNRIFQRFAFTEQRNRTLGSGRRENPLLLHHGNDRVQRLLQMKPQRG